MNSGVIQESKIGVIGVTRSFLGVIVGFTKAVRQK